MKRFKYLTLAALVAFAACDEGSDVTPPVDVTGTVSGVVTIEGTGASGISVTLSTGQTASTDGSGTYSFTGVAAGAHTVAISGFASDVSFSATVKAVTIASSGQVATANFDGSYIRTSAILGAVTGGGTALAGITVSISGTSSSSTTTDAGGQYSFSGLRAGSYTVTMSGFDASMYEFASSSSSISLGAGASEVVNFSGTLVTTASISGYLFLDENDKDDIYTSGLEDAFTIANIAITAEGGGVAATPQMTTVTDANGYYEFTSLAAGAYRVTIDDADADIPGMVAFGGTTDSPVVDVTAGESEVVNWPFDIVVQRVDVYGFLGVDEDNPGIAAIEDWNIILYDTQANAAAAAAAGELDDEDTDEDGGVMFRFDRDDDVSPNEDETDQIVFAAVAAAPSATHAVNGEMIIEIKYNAKDSVVMAPDTFDALYTELDLLTTVMETDGDVAAGWTLWLDVAEDVDDAGKSWTDATDADGESEWTITLAQTTALGGDGTLPDTIWFTFPAAQAAAGGHGFEATADATDGMSDENAADMELLAYVWDGTISPGEVVDVGAFVVKYTDSDVSVVVHREQDDDGAAAFGADASDATPTFTDGDGFKLVDLTRVELFDEDGDQVGATMKPAVGTGLVTFPNVDVDENYTVEVRSTQPGKIMVLTPSSVDFLLDGSDQAQSINPLAGEAGNSTFAVKSKNNTLRGYVKADDDTRPEDIVVKLTAPNNIQGSADDETETDAAGFYIFTGLVEGPYEVTVEGVADEWGFNDVLEVGSVPNGSGDADNDAGDMATRDIEGSGQVVNAHFQADALNTSIAGVIVNDRDSDFNTLDPDEALSGVTVNLYNDDDGDGDIDDDDDLVIETTTTSSTGAFSFEDLIEGDYIVEAESTASATVLRALDADGSVTNWIGVTTEAGTGNCALADCTNQDNTNEVGTTDPTTIDDELPRWDYVTGMAADDAAGAPNGPNLANAAPTSDPTHFMHLFATGTVTGALLETGSTDPAVDVTVTITRCADASTNGAGGVATLSPPVGFATGCDVKHGSPSTHIQNADTDSAGEYTFSGLLEGVYQIDVAPATGGYTTNHGPDDAAASGDEVIMLAIVGNNDVETVPDYFVSG